MSAAPLFGKKKEKAENRLEQLLLNAANDVTQRQQFYKEFLDSTVFSIGEVKGVSVPLEGSLFLATEKAEFSIAAFDLKGEKVAALFTSLSRVKEALGKDFGKERWFSTTARDLLKALHPQWRIVLNPNGPFGHEFTHDEIQLLLDGRVSELESTIQTPMAEYVFRRPEDYPKIFLDYISRYFQERADIAEAYVIEVSVPSKHEPWHLMIGIRLGNRVKTRFGEVLAGIDRIAKAKLGSGIMVDIIEIRTREDQDKWFSGTEPFYRNS